MQTFIPSSNMFEIAKILDSKRLFKQVVEARQILATLGCKVLKADNSAYVDPIKNFNHPAVLMWSGFEEALKFYHDTLLHEVKNIRNYKTKMEQLLASKPYRTMFVAVPEFFYDDELIKSHQSNLLRKDPSHYSVFGWKVPDNLPYKWPITKDNHGKIKLKAYIEVIFPKNYEVAS